MGCGRVKNGRLKGLQSYGNSGSEYEVTQYDVATGEGGLFVEYINKFLKLKAEASGYPNWVRTPAD